MEGISALNSRFSIPITLLLLALLSLTIVATKAQNFSYLGDDCENSTEQPLSSTYQNTINNVLSRLTTDAGTRATYYNSIGVGAKTDAANETINGLYDCRGDMDISLCQSCVSTAHTTILSNCPYRVSAVMRYDYCILRYSNHNFVGSLTMEPNWIRVGNKSITEPAEADTTEDYMRSLIRKATQVTNQSYAMGEFYLSNGEKRYGMVQCVRDLSNDDCAKCLEAMLGKVPQCCVQKLGWTVAVPSCLVKYQDTIFYEMPNSPTAKQGGNNQSRILIISIISALVAMALLTGIYILLRKKVKKGMPLETTPINFQCNVQIEISSYEDLPTVPFITIQESTNNFLEASKLGEGGFGPVYKGILPDGREIAVKRLSKTSGQGLEEFKNEVIFIAKLQHINLVRLLCCCIHEDEKLLVYEYMPNSSLDSHLFDKDKRKLFDWKLRLSIINGIARGLLYLHHDSQLKVIHRDLKASNILLDYEMNPKISDFGMARIFERGQNQANTKRIMGTYGYMAPEYAMEGLFSVKSDVFSFGVLMLEIISGQRNSGFYLSSHGQSLLVYTWKLWCEGKSLELVDRTLEKSDIGHEVARCIHIGLLCVQEDAADRPTMSGVVLMLGSDAVTLRRPNHPAFSVGRMALGEESSMKNPMDPSINDVTISNISPR